MDPKMYKIEEKGGVGFTAAEFFRECKSRQPADYCLILDTGRGKEKTTFPEKVYTLRYV